MLAPLVRGSVVEPLTPEAMELFRAASRVRVLGRLVEVVGDSRIMLARGERVYLAAPSTMLGPLN
jgi:hypothetical protein